MARHHVVIAFLSGAVLALGAALVVTSDRVGLPSAYGQAAAADSGILAIMGTMNQGRGPTDNLYVVDTKTTRLAIYQWNGSTLGLGAVRNFQYDLKFQEYSANKRPQDPTVQSVLDATRQEDSQPKKK
jgi:hypothetical protein